MKKVILTRIIQYQQVSLEGYYVSLYTSQHGEIVTIYEEQGYGAGGNGGIYYLPHEGVVTAEGNWDNAGADMYEVYWKWNGYELSDINTEMLFIVLMAIMNCYMDE